MIRTDRGPGKPLTQKGLIHPDMEPGNLTGRMGKGFGLLYPKP